MASPLEYKADGWQHLQHKIPYSGFVMHSKHSIHYIPNVITDAVPLLCYDYASWCLIGFVKFVEKEKEHMMVIDADIGDDDVIIYLFCKNGSVFAFNTVMDSSQLLSSYNCIEWLHVVAQINSGCIIGNDAHVVGRRLFGNVAQSLHYDDGSSYCNSNCESFWCLVQLANCADLLMFSL